MTKSRAKIRATLSPSSFVIRASLVISHYSLVIYYSTIVWSRFGPTLAMTSFPPDSSATFLR